MKTSNPVWTIACALVIAGCATGTVTEKNNSKKPNDPDYPFSKFLEETESGQAPSVSEVPQHHPEFISQKDDNGYTALMRAIPKSYHIAASPQYFETVKTLLDRGADVNATNKYGLPRFTSSQAPTVGRLTSRDLSCLSMVLLRQILAPQ